MNKISKSIPDSVGQYHVPALEKGLDVLELLADAPQGLTLKEIADQLDRNSQELFRVVWCLTARGYLLRDEAQRLRISTKLFELGSRHSSDQALAARAMPHMQKFAEITGESCQLLIVVRERLLVIAAAESSASVRFGLRVGALIDLFNSITGLVAAAFQPSERRRELAEQRRAYLKSHRDLVPAMARSARDWEEELQAIRACGYAVADSPVTSGSRVYTAPVLGAGGSLLAVFCMTRLPRVGEQPPVDQPYVEAMVACAAAISAEFGSQPSLAS